MQAECRGSCDLRNVEGKTWHAVMALVETLKMGQERTLLLLQLLKLFKYRAQLWGIRPWARRAKKRDPFSWAGSGIGFESVVVRKPK